MPDQPLKNNLLMIPDILKNHSDADHTLTQKDIQKIFKDNFKNSAFNFILRSPKKLVLRQIQQILKS